MSYFNNYNTTFNTTNYYTTLGDFTNVYVDLGTVYADLSFNQTINGLKSYSIAPMTNYPTTSYQLTNKQYIDDNFDIINYKVTIPISNNIMTTIPTGGMQTICTNTKRSFTPFQNFTTIKKKKIITQIDAPVNVDTHYTFGGSRPAMWLAGGASQLNGNSLAFSYDGLNWTGIASTDISGVRALAFNGSIYVAGCSITAANDTLNYGGGYGARTNLAYSYNGINWTPNWYANNIFSIGVYGLAWNGSIFVAAGQGGNTLGYSYDGIRWLGSMTLSPFTLCATAIAWNGSLWVAAGAGTCTSAYSYDGIRWIGNSPTVPFNSTIGNCIATDGVRWLIGGQNLATNVVFGYSFNGAQWTTVAQLPGQITSLVSGIAWNGFMWIAVGTGTWTITYSYDGINWTQVPTSNNIFAQAGWGRCVAWNGYMWVAGGGQSGASTQSTLAYSYNGYTWFPLAREVLSFACNVIIWSGRRENIMYFPQNRTLLLGSGTNFQLGYTPPYIPGQGQTDYITTGYISGLNWTESTLTTGITGSVFSQSANGAAWNGFKWIAVGTPTNTAYGFGNTMAFSTIMGNTVIGNAGNVWVGMQNRVFNLSGTNIGWNGNLWVATGQGGNSIAWSSDGNSWFGLGTGVFTNFGQTIAWNGQYWLAGGSGFGNTMAFSYDGIQWTGLGNNIFNIQCNGLSWNGSIWVAVGYGAVNTMAYSQDGFNWVGLGRNSFSVQGNDVASNASGTLWVATGAGGNIIVNSADGINWWKPTTTITGNVGNSVTWNGKYWIASGNFIISAVTHTNAYSWDSANWTGLGSGIFTAYGMRAVWNQGLGTTYTKNNYLIKSNLNTTAPLTVFFGQKSTVYYSSNGVVWNTKVQPFSYDTVVGIAYNGKIWVASMNTQGGSLYSFMYSYDGINWVFANTKISDNVGVVVTNNSIFVVGSTTQNLQYYSYDGINWLVGYNNSLVFPLNVFIWNSINHFWIGMGGTGATSGASNITSGVAYSVDGIGWFNMPNCNIVNFVCRGLAWNGRQFVAVGIPVINTLPSVWASYDGQRWERGILTNPLTNTTAPTTGLVSNDPFSNTGTGFTQRTNIGRSVAWNGKMWLACGSGLLYGCNTSIIYSYDGVLWFNQPFNSDIFGAAGAANNIIWNGVMWICNGLSSTGSSQLAYSYNGLNWFISNYNNNGTIMLNNNSTSTFQANTLTNLTNLQMYFNGPTQSKTLDIVSDSYYNTGYTKIIFNV